MKNISLGAITTLLLLFITGYGVLQWYRLPKDNKRWAKQIENCLDKSLQSMQQANKNQVERKASLFKSIGVCSDWNIATKAAFQYTQTTYNSLDSLAAEAPINSQQLMAILNKYQSEITRTLCEGLEDTMLISQYKEVMIPLLGYLQPEITNISLTRAKMFITLAAKGWYDIIEERCWAASCISPAKRAIVFPQTEIIQPNDTLQLNIYLDVSDIRRICTAVVNGKVCEVPYYDSWARYETVLHKAGTFQLDGTTCYFPCLDCNERSIPFSRTYTVEECR
jgi:hypothetical protein